jgi:hypothetical protein
LIGVAGVIVFAAVGFFVFGKLTKGSAEDKPVAEQPAQKKAANPAAPQAAAGTKQSQVAAEKKAGTSATPASATPTAQTKTETPAQPKQEQPASAAATSPVAPTAASTSAVASAPTTQPTTQPAAAKPVAEAAPEPSAAFTAWVKNLKITGLRTGAVPRILVDRATFAAGDTINTELGIMFDGYDASRRMLRFKDKTGAVVERRER